MVVNRDWDLFDWSTGTIHSIYAYRGPQRK